MEKKFFRCKHCGNLVEVIHASGVSIVCCGEEMELLVPNVTEAAGEKHLPVVNVEGDIMQVNIGEVNHPMVDVHYIEWVYLETTNGCQRKHLKPGDSPSVTFDIGDDKPIAVYAYCNIHGLWKTEIL